MTNNLIVERKTILLGDIELEVFKLPSGDYQLSQTQVAEAVGKLELSTRQFLTSKSPYAAPYKAFSPVKSKVKGQNHLVNLISIPQAAAYWAKETEAGNTQAGFLLVACAYESIQQRADKAYGIERDVEFYNEQVKIIRGLGVETRKVLTQAIQEYIQRNDLKGGFASCLISNTSKKINKKMFNKTAKQIREEGGKSKTRDNLSFSELRDLENFENAIAAFVSCNNIHPYDALERAYRMINAIGGFKTPA